MTVQSYQERKVWRKAMDLAEKCYQVTKSFPKDELYGMTSQIRRAEEISRTLAGLKSSLEARV